MNNYPIEDARHPAIEDMLDRLGMRWSLEEIKLTDIDVEASLANQVRLGGVAVDPSRADDYGQLLAKGVKFPAVIAVNGDGPVTVVDGNHRLVGASKHGIESIYAYVVEAPTLKQSLALRGYANSYVGLGQTTDEKIAHGLDLVRAGETVSKAADIVGIARPRLNTEHNLTQARQRARAMGMLTQWDALPWGIRSKLSAARTSDPILARAITFAQRSTVKKSNYIGEVVRKAREALSEADAVSVFDDEEEAQRRDTEIGEGPVIDADDREAANLSRTLSALAKHDGAKMRLWLDNRARPETRARWLNLIKDAQAVLDALAFDEKEIHDAS